MTSADKHSDKTSIRTGYEIYHPGTEQISMALTQVRLAVGMVLKAVEKREKGYIDYIVKLNLHHILKPLAPICQAFPQVFGDFYREFFTVEDAVKRLEILNKIYAGCRILDDGIDGDSPIKLTPDQIEEYAAQSAENFAAKSWDKRSAVDGFLAEAMDLCEEVGIDIHPQTMSVLESVKFDAGRRADFMRTGIPKFIPEEELAKHYYDLDIKGTIGACLVLTDEEDTEENRALMEPLGTACRLFYDMRDLSKETGQGLISITQEDAERLGISMESLTTWSKENGKLEEAPEEIQNWVKEKTAMGWELLEEYKANMQKAPFKDVTKKIAEKGFVDQCTPFFEKMDKKFPLAA